MRKKIIYVICPLAIVISIISICLIAARPKEEIKPNPLQYYGQVVSIKVENNQKIIKVKGVSTPYAEYDNILEGDIELIAPDSISIKMRMGLSNKKPKFNLGDLSIMYEDLQEGDQIAFRFKDLVFENRKEIDEIIFTGN